MSNDKLFVGQKRSWHMHSSKRGESFEIMFIGNNKALYKYPSDGFEDSEYIRAILDFSEEVKPEPKRTKLCAFIYSHGEMAIEKESWNASGWTKKNLVVIDGEVFVEEN